MSRHVLEALGKSYELEVRDERVHVAFRLGWRIEPALAVMDDDDDVVAPAIFDGPALSFRSIAKPAFSFHSLGNSPQKGGRDLGLARRRGLPRARPSRTKVSSGLDGFHPWAPYRGHP